MSAALEDVSRLVARSIQQAEPTAKLQGPVVNDESHALCLVVGPGQQIWITDDDVSVSQLPAGSIHIDAPIAQNGLPTVSITPGLTTGEATISGGNYKILDDKFELDDWFQQKTANGFQLFGGQVKHYIFPSGTSISAADDLERALVYTWLVRGQIKLNRRVYTIPCEDVQRDFDTDIFIERTHTVLTTIAADAESEIEVYLDEEDREDLEAATWLFEHGSDYQVHPSEFRAIGLISNGDKHEFISWTGLTDSGRTVSVDGGALVPTYRLTNPARGLFGTSVQQWDVDDSSALSSRMQIKSVVYAEEHPHSMALGCMTGNMADGRVFPWGLDREGAVDVASFPMDERRRTYRPREKANCKTFVEEHCFARRGFMVPNAFGTLSYRAAPVGSETASISVILSEAQCTSDNDYTLAHDDSDAATGLTIKWDQDRFTGAFRKNTKFILGPELNETSATEPIEIEAPFLTTGWSTESEVRRDAQVLYSRYARPVKRINVQPVWDLWKHLPGEVAFVDLPVNDYAVVGPSVRTLIDRMMIGRVSRNHNTRKLSWSLVGFRPLPQGVIPATVPPEDEFFTEGGTEITFTNGVADLGQTLHCNRKYYTLTGGTLPPNFFDDVRGSGTLRIYSKGTLLWGASLDGTGKGGAGGLGSLAGAGESGEQGFVAARPPSGSVEVITNRFANSSGDPQDITERTVRSRPPADRLGRSGAVTQASTVTIENNQLVGVPTTLMGSGGDGGDLSTYAGTADENPGPYAPDSGQVIGSGGGAGGIGVEIVAPVGSGFVGDGEIIVDGSDGLAAGRIAITDGASGAGGAHGFVKVYHFGQGTPWQFDGIRLEAHHGIATLDGEPAPRAGYYNRGPTNRILRSFYEPDVSQENEWANAFSIEFLPTSQIAGNIEYASSFDEFFATQPDGRVALIISDVPPSDGNFLDMYITEDELANGGAYPEAFIFGRNGWETTPFDWDDEFAHVYAALIAINREQRGTEFYIAPNGAIPAGIEDGDLFFDTRTRISYIYRADGNHEPYLDEESRLGDERGPDPNLVRTRNSFESRGFLYYYAPSSFDELPLQSGPVNPPETGVTLSAPFNVSFNEFSPSTGAIQYSQPFNAADITGYRIYLDGVEVATVGSDVFYVEFSNLTSGFTHTAGVQSVGNGGQVSQIVTDQTTPRVGTEPVGRIVSVVVTGGYTGSTLSISPPTNVSFVDFSSTDGQVSWTESIGQIDGYRVYRDGALIATINDDVTDLYIDTGLSAGQSGEFAVAAYIGTTESTRVIAPYSMPTSNPTNAFAVISNGPTVEVSGTDEMNGRGLFMEFRDANGNVVHSITRNFSANRVAYTPPPPSTNYSTWTGFIQDSNGDDFSLPNQPVSYNQ